MRALLEACVLLSPLYLLLLRFLENLLQRGRRGQVLLVVEDYRVRILIRRRPLGLQLLAAQLVLRIPALSIIYRLPIEFDHFLVDDAQVLRQHNCLRRVNGNISSVLMELQRARRCLALLRILFAVGLRQVPRYH